MMIASLAAKMAAVAMTVYMTKRAGVWGQAEESDQLIREVSHKVKPLGDKLAIPKLESEMSLAQMAKEVYNRGIKDGFNMLKDLPKYSDELATATKVACLDLAKEMGRNMILGMRSEKSDPAAEKPSTIVIISPGIPLKIVEEAEGGPTNSSSSTTTTSTTTTITTITGSTDLAIKQEAGTTPSILEPSAKQEPSR